MWLKKLIENHVTTNLVFLLILLSGTFVYSQLPREQDPTVNFNWVQITTVLPGATAEDVEKKVTDVLEESLEGLQDIKFVSSTSRENLSSILVRFQDIDDDRFEKRIADLRREISSAEADLPDAAKQPNIFEITTANAFPTATVVLTAPSDGENLRRQARAVEKDLARIPGVDRVQPTGLRSPEIHILFDPVRIQSLGLSPTDIANSVQGYFVDSSAGTIDVNSRQWLIRVNGTTDNPEQLAQLPISRMMPGNNSSNDSANNNREIRLGDIAQIVRAREKAARLVSYQGQPAVMFAVMKQAESNTLELVDRIVQFIDNRNRLKNELGVEYILIDDQTSITRSALDTMQTNAIYGLFLVLLVSWLFLGSRISFLVTIGIPFTLAGTFIVLQQLGQTLNTSVLLAIVISLGMLVDDAVVVVESIHYKLRRGIESKVAAWTGLLEVIKPVTASVLTTMAAFLPLMLLPGILGKFMMVIPLVVTTALAISLIEAYWMLPGHVLAAKVSFKNPSRVDKTRQRMIHKIQVRYGFALLKILRHPRKTLAGLVLLFALAMSALASGMIRMDFFASDTLRIFYINIDMPASSSLNSTLELVKRVEKTANARLEDGEARSVVSYAGQQFTDTAPRFGNQVGQVLISLNPQQENMRSVEAIIESMRPGVEKIVGAQSISFLKLAGGPPTSKPVSIKLRGDDFNQIRAAADTLSSFMNNDPRFTDINDDDEPGSQGLTLKLNSDAINRLGISPSEVRRTINMLANGEIISSLQSQGDSVSLRLKSLATSQGPYQDLQAFLDLSLTAPNGQIVPLRELVIAEKSRVKGNIFHYNFLRTITIEADIDKQLTDTVQANTVLRDFWQTIAADYPTINPDYTGELDDINESLDAIGGLFLFGIGLMYLILATQFQSYFQPMMILVSVPLAFIGVVLGLIVSGNPLSLYTLYGIVALAGIAVNSSIVLISTANDNLRKGMTLIHAIFYASRRRMLPIMITTLTTIAGLFSLAFGLGGESLLWSPVATAIVWGLFFSSFLTLFIIPALYQMSMRKAARKLQEQQ
ncbi:efflux RND transporter permease subunit [Pelagibaculum spongiae]|uniref:AcrB/AcrD/AcrF family protein n=1 Tax=Pelagibaculum spongiae TaxID=2080658 RepID=A0A2V1GQE2_9GAMM|nr:efflux RND transporter permease subunit [Pelagibaculum spongiae]PVZ65692.1 AcrB/AcrD/AcrF family protein [Pelagibaculum spongiae]